jgi:hypothetical protein
MKGSVFTMQETMARDLLLRSVAQEVATITGLDESPCRQSLYAITDSLFAPDMLIEATEQLLAGLREQDNRNRFVIAFWAEMERRIPEQAARSSLLRNHRKGMDIPGEQE